MEWMILPLKRYADFEGRSRRLEYWMFSLFLLMVLVALVAVAAGLGAFAENDGQTSPALAGIGIVAVIGYLAILVPSIAVTVRRLHDQNLSGWLYLLGFIPYVGGLILLVFMLIPGTKGENQYGPDPKGGPDAEDLERVFG